MRQGKLSIIVGTVILAVILVLASFAPVITDYDPIKSDNTARFEEISREHIMGTDNFGRDIFSRVLYGGRITLFLSFFAMIATGIMGILIGVICALNYGRVIDIIFMRLVDIVIAMPFIVVAMAVATLMGRGLDKLLLVAILTGWASFARLARSLTISLNYNSSVIAARALGASQFQIIKREILPRIIFPMLINITLELSNIILSLSTLSFFGMGSKPPNPEWGSMLSDGRTYLTKSPNILIFPCIFIFLTVLSLNLIGEGFRDYTNPYESVEWENN